MTLPLLLSMSLLLGPDPTAKSPSGPETLVDQQRLMATIRSLPTKRSATGDAEHRDGLVEAQRLLVAKVKELGLTPVEHAANWARRGEKPDEQPAWKTIEFDLPGTDLAGEVLLVSAHFDAVPGAPGADDDASGVAAVLELARVLKGREHHRTIRFVLFNLEEAMLSGSRQYVQANKPKWAEQNVKVVGMLSLEMLGYYDPKPGSQTNPFKGVPGLPQGEIAGDFIALTTVASHAPFCGALAEAMLKAEPNVKVLRVDMFPIAPPDLMRSDHAPFLAVGIPAIMVTDTANFRNPNYHKPTDTVETLNPEYYARTVRALAGAIGTLAGPKDLPAPQWKRATPPPPPPTSPPKPAEDAPPAESSKPGA